MDRVLQTKQRASAGTDRWVIGFGSWRRLVALSLICTAVTGIAPRAFAQIKQSASTARAADDADAIKARRARLGAAKTWGYQLRIKDLMPLYGSDPDLLVIDHGLAARRDGKLLFDADEIGRLKVRTDGRRRIVLSYLSIGEAEQYRYYWQGAWCSRATAPRWVGAVNPNWPGNYPVRFWDPEWQGLITDGAESYLAKIQGQGFDGIYLDRADVWSEWTRERPTAERDMVNFLQRIAKTARSRDPGFLVVMQNAEELLAHRAVRRVLDGVAKEDLLHGINFTEAANDAETVKDALAHLKRGRAEGLPIFAVEYLADPLLVDAARQRLSSFGFVPTFAPRLLDTLGEVRPVPRESPRSPPAALPAQSTWGEGGPTCLLD